MEVGTSTVLIENPKPTGLVSLTAWISPRLKRHLYPSILLCATKILHILYNFWTYRYEDTLLPVNSQLRHIQVEAFGRKRVGRKHARAQTKPPKTLPQSLIEVWKTQKRSSPEGTGGP